MCFLLIWSSCRKDLEYGPSAGNLEFSKDTVFLDTVFSNIASSTYILKVYNRNRDDLEIPSIRLEQGENSQYRLNVDGVAGKEFTNVPIFAKDSLFIFIETTYAISNEPAKEFLYTDVLQFDSGIHQQNVQLVTLVKDAILLYPATRADGTKETLSFGLDGDGNEIRSEGFYLKDDQLNFTNEIPYVIYGYAAVEANKQLTMEAGTRVYFHKNSGLFIGPGAEIHINGALSLDEEAMENEVVFEGDRLEPGYAKVPGQWESLWLAKGSTGNSVNHLTIKNATVGIFVEGDEASQSPTLTITNTQIYNSSLHNLWAKKAVVLGENLVLGGAGGTSLLCSLGGDYTFTHCTIANYWTHGYRTGVALLLNNYDNSVTGSAVSGDLTRAHFFNCIIDGNAAQELVLKSNGTNTFNYFFDHCLIRFENNSEPPNDPLYHSENTTLFNQPLINLEANFTNALMNDFTIGANSSAIEGANIDRALQVPNDILGVDRTVLPDIGAYQN